MSSSSQTLNTKAGKRVGERKADINIINIKAFRGEWKEDMGRVVVPIPRRQAHLLRNRFRRSASGEKWLQREGALRGHQSALRGILAALLFGFRGVPFSGTSTSKMVLENTAPG